MARKGEEFCSWRTRNMETPFDARDCDQDEEDGQEKEKETKAILVWTHVDD